MDRDVFLSRAEESVRAGWSFPDLPDPVGSHFVAVCPEGHRIPNRPRAGHLRGQGCRVCTKAASAALANQRAADSFVPEMQVKFAGLCSYELVEYIDSTTPVQVICLVDDHGVFPVTPKHQRNRDTSGCPKCGSLGKAKARRRDDSDVFSQLGAMYGDGLDFAASVYAGTAKPMSARCTVHNTTVTKKTAAEFLAGSGCAMCGNARKGKSKLEKCRAEFATKASARHQGRYVYPRANYRGQDVELVVTCLVHGDFEVTPRRHLGGRGCLSCANESRRAFRLLTQAEFLARAAVVHGGRFGYENAVYTGMANMIAVTCHTHGDWLVRAGGHVSGGHGCPGCAGVAPLTLDEFIRRSVAIHGDAYDYADTVFRGTAHDVAIRCRSHDVVFTQVANNHLRGHGCRECGHEKIGDHFRMTQEEFVRRAQIVHGARYDYSRTVYRSQHQRITILCAKHGEVETTPSSHLRGSNCAFCATEGTADLLRMSLDEFTARGRAIHGERFAYDQVVYRQYFEPVILICTDCDTTFSQTPALHLAGYGCSTCREYAGEKAVRAFLDASGFQYVAQFGHDELRYRGKLKIDFAIPELRLAIEFDGPQHRGPVLAWGAKTPEQAQANFEQQLLRDQAKEKWAAERDWTLVRIGSVAEVADILTPLLAPAT